MRCTSFRRRSRPFQRSRLADGGQAGILERSALDIVKTDYGNIFGNAAVSFAQGANRSNAEISLKANRAVNCGAVFSSLQVKS